MVKSIQFVHMISRNIYNDNYNNLKQLFSNSINPSSRILHSVTIARMEVPCCSGIENAVKRALQASGKFIPWRVFTISTDGRTLD